MAIAMIFGEMNPKHLIGPVLALAVAGMLLVKQRRNVAGLEAENLELRRLILDVPGTDDGTRSQIKRPMADQPIDWDKLAGLLRDNTAGNQAGMYSIQRRLLAMDTAELLAALDHIAPMDEATRLILENLILDALCKKDPEAALERFKGKLRGQEGMETYQLTQALKDWAKKDLMGATVWLDREVAAGTFDARSLDGKNSVWTRLEAAVVFGQFPADPTKAEARLSNLPPAMREDILGQADNFHKMREGDEIAYAEIVRRQLDEKGRVAAIAGRAKKTLDRGGDFAAVDEYLNSVYAAPDERERAAAEVAGTFAQSLAQKKELRTSEIEEMRTWAARDAPGAVGRLTGQALGMAVSFGGSMDFAEASALALRYRESDGNDDALHGFLSKLDPMTNKAEARRLAETITDSGKREDMIRRFE